MYVLEAVFLSLTLALLVYQNTRGASTRISLILLAGGGGAALLMFALGQARIHLAPAALVFLVSALLLLRRAYSHLAIRAIGILVGFALLAASAFLTLALPVVRLPPPEGPHAVGVTWFTLVDDSRNEAVFGAPERSREIYVQAWYPGTIGGAGPRPRVRALWQELYGSAIGKVFFGYLGGIDTHSFEDIPVSTSQTAYPTLIFSPALAGIAEQNTLLMEHLASHGYIVFALTHPYFGIISAYADGSRVPVSDNVLTGMSQQGAVDLDAIAEAAERAGTPIDRAGIWLEYFEQGEMLNEFTRIWVDDLKLVLDAITLSPEALPAPIAGRVDDARLGLLGMSFGSGAVTELCKRDARCKAAVNLDGGLWGESMRQPLHVPYLALANPGNRPFFEHDLLTSQAPYYALTVDGATHPNFTDVSVFVPLLQWLGVTGPIEGERVIDIMNEVSRRFFDRYLRDAAESDLRFEEFPELSVQSNSRNCADGFWRKAGMSDFEC